MHPPVPEYSSETVARLLHDLRQPITNIGLSLFYLNLLMGDPGGKVREQLGLIERQVERASDLINQAAADLDRSRSQPAAVNLELTNSATSPLT
jgi:signal transduction histidine kinase